jgi:hypothetical protein
LAKAIAKGHAWVKVVIPRTMPGNNNDQGVKTLLTRITSKIYFIIQDSYVTIIPIIGFFIDRTTLRSLDENSYCP